MAFHSSFKDETNKPTPKSYTISDLSQALVERTQLPILQRLDVKQRKLLRKLPEFLVPSMENYATLVVTYGPILDQMFFFNSLLRQVNGYRFLHQTDIPKHERGDNGLWKSAEKEIHVNIDATTNRGTYPQQIICVLLHEMLHAFLDIYSCGCSTGCKAERTDGLGTTGHGDKWCEPMTAMAIALERDLRWEVDVGLEISVTMEVAAGWEPSDCELSRWGLMRRWKDEEGKRVEIIEKPYSLYKRMPYSGKYRHRQHYCAPM